MSHFLTVPIYENDIVLDQANLTPLHQSTAVAYGAAGKQGGQHSDINLPQVYDMLARFFGQ